MAKLKLTQVKLCCGEKLCLAEICFCRVYAKGVVLPERHVSAFYDHL